MEQAQLESIIKRWGQMKSHRSQYTGVWNDIGKYVNVFTQDMDNVNQTSNGRQMDIELNDSTAHVAATQAADSLFGIAWGDGEDVFEIVPSDELKESIKNEADVKQWYQYASRKILSEMNHSKANFSGAKRCELFEKVTIGTGGLGTFRNEDYVKGKAENALEYRAYTVKSIAIDIGKNGLPDTVGVEYKWRINQIVSTFCMKQEIREDGSVVNVLDDEKFNRLPDKWKDAYNNEDINSEFPLVCMIMPQDHFKKGVEGKYGAQYIAVWFTEDPKIEFATEYHKKMPINAARMAVIAGEVYGRGFATTALGSIKLLNFAMGDTAEALEKSVHPPLGVFQNGLFGDDVIDASSNGVTVVSGEKTNGQNPIFSLSDVKDVSGIINFLFPYIQNQISDAFKTDALMDFNNNKEMTATEAFQRMKIRANVLRGVLNQEKNESMLPTIETSISLLLQMGLLGSKPTDNIAVEQAAENNAAHTVIPQKVFDFMNQGKIWYKIKFKNELAKLAKTEQMEGVQQLLMVVGALAQYDPKILAAVKSFNILDATNGFLNNPTEFLETEKVYKDMVAQMMQQAQNQNQLDNMNTVSQVGKNVSSAKKDQKDAERTG